MNKKANLSLVILSVVALFAIGSLAIMYNSGATGAAIIVGPVLENEVIVLGDATYKIHFSFLSTEYAIKRADVIIDSAPLGFHKKLIGPIDPIVQDGDVKISIIGSESFDIIARIDQGLSEFELKSNPNKGHMEFDFDPSNPNSPNAMIGIIDQIETACSACLIRDIEPFSFKVQTTELVERLEFRIIEPQVTDLGIAISGPTASTIGNTDSYIFRVENFGPGMADDPLVQITIPGNANAVLPLPGGCFFPGPPGQVACALADMNNGAVVNRQINVQWTGPDVASLIEADVSFLLSDSNPSNDFASLFVNVV